MGVLISDIAPSFSAFRYQPYNTNCWTDMEGITWRRHTNIRRTIGPFLHAAASTAYKQRVGGFCAEKNIGFARQRADREPGPPPDGKIAETHNNSRR